MDSINVYSNRVRIHPFTLSIHRKNATQNRLIVAPRDGRTRVLLLQIQCSFAHRKVLSHSQSQGRPRTHVLIDDHMTLTRVDGHMEVTSLCCTTISGPPQGCDFQRARWGCVPFSLMELRRAI